VSDPSTLGAVFEDVIVHFDFMDKEVYFLSDGQGIIIGKVNQGFITNTFRWQHGDPVKLLDMTYGLTEPQARELIHLAHTRYADYVSAKLSEEMLREDSLDNPT